MKPTYDELSTLVERLKDLSEYWIDQARHHKPSKQEYETWLALGHHSKALHTAKIYMQRIKQGNANEPI